MLAKILHTFTSRVGIAGLNFLIVMLTAQILGASGRGEIGIFGANLTLVILFTGILGGTGLAYLTPRTNIYQLLLPAYLWSVLVSGLVTGLLYFLDQVPPEYAGHLFGLSLLLALFTVNTTVLVGKEKVKVFNYLSFLQTLLLIGVLAAGFLVFKLQTIAFYFTALYWAYGITFALSLVAVLLLPDRPDFSGFQQNLLHLLRFGSTAQLSNIITFLNYRLGYYFLNTLTDSKAVGIFSVGVSLSEAIWMVGRSLALVQYAKLVNTEDPEAAKQLTIKLARLSFMVTALAVLVLALLPPVVFQLIFGQEFGSVNTVIWSLGLGIIAIGTSTIFSHYFAGRGKYNVNNWASFSGLLLTVPACWLLIPKFGFVGAALASTFSYLVAFAFLYWKFRRETGFTLAQLLPGREDFQELKKLLRRK
ncbi:polysaccharide biosynthesis C-terminal domain-containing protein [Adhaeribacter sp. BT258]|uniref:Polysaccharide biosynthesis C-terminal domain-containing protein n=1 Tax=Adhaeribacter terrigena TaxID=2793070 RepID=A0ABS1C5K6_9BACT|nr:polysaccharide biosynthesis C-terminal domain-containing protein [Adhaeribacter terrigena]MBK0404496.1 polysaccharide biosynthesis C-terminal domain-containing protein [Adhaeribacter terrigena]